MTSASRRATYALLAVFCVLLGACQPQADAPEAIEESSGERYILRGEVVSLTEETMTAVIDHEEIEGWMDAMMMGFPVKDRSEWEKLAVGDRIKATVFVEDPGFYLGKIEVVEAAAGEEAEP